MSSVPAADSTRIAVIGLGYGGLPLAVAFGDRYPTLGFDIDAMRIAQLQNSYDRTRQVPSETLSAIAQLHW